MAKLQVSGIACGVMQDGEDMIVPEPQMAGRGALVKLDHLQRIALGHVEVVSHELCGQTDARIAELASAGVFP